MAKITVEGLSIPVSKTITSLVLTDARQVERLSNGDIHWNGSVTLKGENGEMIPSPAVNMALRNNSTAKAGECEVVSQNMFYKSFSDCSVSEYHQVIGNVLASKMIDALNASNSGITVSDVTSLVTAIVSALA